MIEHTREPISDRMEEPPKGDFYVMIEHTREQQDPGPISDRTDEPPEGDVYQGSIFDCITMTLDPAESHSPPQPPNTFWIRPSPFASTYATPACRV